MVSSILIFSSFQISFNESQTICLACFSTLKTFHELLETVRSNYNYQQIPLVKCEVFESDCLTVTELLPIKEDDLKDEEFFGDVTTKSEQIEDDECDYVPPTKKPRAPRTKFVKTKQKKEDQDYVPPSVAAQIKKAEVAAAKQKAALEKPAPSYEVSGPFSKKEKRSRKESWAANNQKIRDFVEVKCHLCNIPLDSYFQLHKHFKATHPEHKKGFLMCCGRKFDRRYELIEHINFHIMPNLYHCDLCPARSFKQKNGLQYHMKMFHLGDQTPKTCEICQKEFKNEQMLKSHSKFHEVDEEKTFECYKCQKQYSNIHRLKLHYTMSHKISKHPPRTYVCEICSEVVDTREKFKSHVARHKELEIIERGEGFKCPQCDRVFAYQSKVDKHIERIHNVSTRKTYICEVCSRVLKSLHSLKQHRRTFHSDVPEQARIPCHICGNLMKNNRSMQKHLQKHRENAEMEHICKECGHVSKSKGALWTHVRYTHKLKRNLPCQFCPKMFKMELDVQEHEATHTGIDLYQCEFCPQTFKFGASYRGHRKRNHPKEYEIVKPKWMAKA